MNQVEICNMALMRIGHDRLISSLTEKSAEAGYARAFWDVVRRSVLRAHPWNFATKRVVLAMAGAGTGNWAYVYALPANCLRVLGVDLFDGGPRAPFEIRGKDLFTNQAEASLVYIADVTDENLFDSLFVDAMAYRLAAEISGPLTQDAQRQARLFEMYRLFVKEAQTGDATERVTEPSKTYLEARA